jgi:hypothetical protein
MTVRMIASSSSDSTGCVIVVMLCIFQRVISDSSASGVRYAPLDDERHMFHARGPATVPWSAQLAADFMVLQYDRKNGAVVGYQRSTGKVFAQRKVAAAQEENHNLRLDHAVLLSLAQRTAFHLDHSRPCTVLTLAPHVEVTDVAWHPLEEMHDMRRHQTWTITSETNRGRRSVDISSNRDSLLHCKCEWDDTRTVWHAVTGTARSNGCTPRALKAIGDLPGDAGDGAGDSDLPGSAVPHAMLEMSVRKRARFCRELSVALSNRILQPVSAHALGSRRASRNEQECWLAAVSENGKHRVSQSAAAGFDTVRPPRATVLMDIKYTIKAIEVVQTMVAIVSKNAQIIAGQSLVLLMRNNNTLAVHNLFGLSHTVHHLTRIRGIHRELRRLLDQKADDPLQMIPVSIPLSCDGSASNELYELLTDQSASMTPESANTTTVGLHFGKYVSEVAKCISSQLEALGKFIGCLSTVHSGSTAGSTIGDAWGSTMQSVSTQLDNVLSESYKRTALDMRQQLIDVSDKVIQTAVAVGDAQVQTARHLMQAFQSAMHSWESRILILKYNAERTRTDNNAGTDNTTDLAPWVDFIADTWCCAVAEPVPLVNGTRQCAGYLERTIRRIMN